MSINISWAKRREEVGGSKWLEEWGEVGEIEGHRAAKVFSASSKSAVSGENISLYDLSFPRNISDVLENFQFFY